jgi:dipeptidyl aminopeptidase/acylaminoacyl peptidase
MERLFVLVAESRMRVPAGLELLLCLTIQGGSAPPPEDPQWPAAAAGSPVVADVRPTLEEIFRPPRLLTPRPREVSVSATGRYVLWRQAAVDAEEPKYAWWLASVESGEPREIVPAGTDVTLEWAPTDDSLLVFRNGWLERLDPATGDAARSEPLFQCGSRRGRLQFSRDGRFAAFTAGADHELWVVELATAMRWAPAQALSDRSPWFEWIELTGEIALFAAPPAVEGAKKTAADPAERPAGPGERAVARDAAARDGGAQGAPEKQKRVLWRVPFRVAPEAGAAEPNSTEPRAPIATQLTEGGRVDLSPDGRYALVQKWDAEPRRELIVADYLAEQVKAVPVRGDLAGDPPPRSSFSVVDLATGSPVPLPLDEGERYFQSEASFAPNGSRLLIQRVSDDAKVRQVLVAELDPPRAWPLFVERDEAWIGGPLQYAAWRGDGLAVVFSSERHGHNQLFLVPVGGGSLQELTARGSEVQEVRLSPHGRELVALTNERDPAERSLRLIDLATGASRELSTPRGGCVGDFAVAREGSAVAFLWESLGVPAELFHLTTREGGRAVQITEGFPDGLRDLGLAAPEIVGFRGSDGTDVRALFYAPVPAPATGERSPAVVFVHGAGYLQNVTRSMTEYPQNYLFHQRLARLGFAVLDIDYRHSAGYGRKFRTDIHGFMGGMDLEDQLAGVEWLRARGDIDASRIGIYGGSYGGFITLMALFTRPEVFACGAALRSVTDWRTYNSWYTTPRLGDPKADAENYRRSSPIDHAEGLRKPLLILHGLKDGNVFAQDSIRLIEKLIQLGKEFDAMLYPSQDHGFTDPESWIDEYRRIERLFRRELRLPAAPRGVAVDLDLPAATSGGTGTAPGR